MELSIQMEVTPTSALLSVTGEVDVSNAAVLRDALDETLETEAGEVACDLSEVPYIDSTGIGVLVGFAHRAAEAGKGFAVRNPQRNVARVLSLLGLGAELGLSEG